MDKKMLLIIFSIISLLIIGGYIYVTYNKLTSKIKLLEKELDEFKSTGASKEILDLGKFLSDQNFITLSSSL